MPLLFEARRRGRERRIGRRRDRKRGVREVLEDFAKDTDIPEDQAELFESNYVQILSLAEEIFPNADSGEAVAELVSNHPLFYGKAAEQQTYGSITSIVTLIKILMVLYELWKKYQATSI